MGKRQIILIEGIKTHIPQYLEVGVLDFTSVKTYPISWMDNIYDPNSLMGYATNIEREGPGIITAEINLKPEKAEMLKVLTDNGDVDSVGLTIHADRVESKRVEGKHLIISSCRLKAVFYSLNIPWAGLTW